MNKNIVITLLTIVLLYLWGRLQVSEARATEYADKAHKWDAEGAALQRMHDTDTTATRRSDQALQDAATEYGLDPITWTDDSEGA